MWEVRVGIRDIASAMQSLIFLEPFQVVLERILVAGIGRKWASTKLRATEEWFRSGENRTRSHIFQYYATRCVRKSQGEETLDHVRIEECLDLWCLQHSGSFILGCLLKLMYGVCNSNEMGL